MVVGAALQFWKCLYCSPLYFCCHRLFKFNKHCIVPTWVRMGIVIRHMQSEVERACVTSRLIIGLTLSHNRNTAIVYAHSSYSDLSAIKGCWLVVIWKGGSSCWYQQGDHWPGHHSSPPLTLTVLVARLLREAHSRVKLSHIETCTQTASSEFGGNMPQIFLHLCLWDVTAPGVTYFFIITII